MHSGPAELHEQAVGAGPVLEMAALPLEPHVPGSAPMAHNPSADAIPACDQRGPGGQAGGVWAVVIVEAHPVPGNAVNGWGGVPAIAIAAQMVGPQIERRVSISNRITRIEKPPFRATLCVYCVCVYTIHIHNTIFCVYFL